MPRGLFLLFSGCEPSIYPKLVFKEKDACNLDEEPLKMVHRRAAGGSFHDFTRFSIQRYVATQAIGYWLA